MSNWSCASWRGREKVQQCKTTGVNDRLRFAAIAQAKERAGCASTQALRLVLEVDAEAVFQLHKTHPVRVAAPPYLETLPLELSLLRLLLQLLCNGCFYIRLCCGLGLLLAAVFVLVVP